MAKQKITTTIRRRTKKNSGKSSGGGKVVQCNMCRGTGYVTKKR